MEAAVGDRMVVAATRLDGPVRDGEVVRTAPGGRPPYLVRWSDTGRETTFFPGPDAHVDHPETTGEAVRERPVPKAAPPHTKHWRVDVYLYEGEDATSAQVVLRGDASSPVTARGQVERSTRSAVIPEVGDEVAVGRALQRLSDRLLGLADEDLAAGG